MLIDATLHTAGDEVWIHKAGSAGLLAISVRLGSDGRLEIATENAVDVPGFGVLEHGALTSGPRAQSIKVGDREQHGETG
jgi:hypothetical protein